MLRKSEYLITDPAANQFFTADKRRPLCNGDILPRWKGEYTDWDSPVDEVVVFLKGSKTDWLNEGTTRNHSALTESHPNAMLCMVRALKNVRRLRPAKLADKDLSPFCCWANGGPIPDTSITTVLREGAVALGIPAERIAPHSLRAGGATALYQATGSIDLVKRMGRWKSDAVSRYIWESHQLLAGLAAKMAGSGHELHRSAYL